MYVSDTDPVLKRLNKQSEAEKPKNVTVYKGTTEESNEATAKPRPEPQSGSKQPLLGNILAAAGTGSLGKLAETFGQLTPPAQLTIGEQARLAAQGKATEADTQAALKEKAARIEANIQEPLYAFSSEMKQQSAEYEAAAKQGRGKVGQFVADVGIAGAQFAGDVLLGAINPALGTASLGARAFGGAAQEAREAGATETQQQLYGLGSAALSIGVEKIANVGKLFTKAYGNGATSVFEKLASKLTKSAAGQRILAGFAGEATEEAIEAALNPVLRRVTYDTEAIAELRNDPEARAEYVSDILYGALIGGSLGAIGGGFGGVRVGTAPTVAQEAPPSPADSRLTIPEGNNAPVEQNAVESPTEPFTAVETEQALEPIMESAAENVAQQPYDPLVAAARAQAQPTPTISDPLIDSIRKLPQTVDSVKESPATPEWFTPVIDQEIKRGRYTTTPISNSETVAKVIASFNGKTFDEVRDGWLAKAHAGAINAETMVEGQLLYNNAVNSGDEATARQILYEYVKMGTTTGRALQIMRLMKTVDPDTKLYMIQRSAREMVESLDLGIDLTADPQFIALEEKYRAAATDTERDLVIDELAKYVAQFKPTTINEALRMVRYTNMLGNLKTQVRNVAGNFGMSLVSRVKNAVSTGLQRLFKRVDNTRAIFVSKDLRAIGKRVFEENEQAILSQGKYQDGVSSANDFARRVEESRRMTNTGIKAMDKTVLALFQWYNDLTQWAMNNKLFGDAAFARASFSRAFGGYLQAKRITPEQWSDPEWQKQNRKTAQAAIEFAAKDAQENTFRNANALADSLTAFINKPDLPLGVKLFLEGLVPFRRTRANIFKTAVDYSPAGLFKAMAMGGKMAYSRAKVENEFLRRVQAKVKKQNITANDIIEELSKGLTGSALIALGAVLASFGILRGGEDDDEKQAAFDELTGHQPYSIEIGNHSYTLDWLSPASLPMFVGADLYKHLADDGLSWEEARSLFNTISDILLDTAMMSGASSTIEGVSYGENPTMQLLTEGVLGYITQILTNTLVGQGERITEPNRMTTYTDPESKIPEFLQYSLGRASAKIPIWDYKQTEYINAWGEKESNGDIAQRFAEQGLSPGYYSKISTDPLEAEIQRLYKATGEDVLPSKASRTIGDKHLTAEEYEQYASLRGHTMHHLMETVTNSAYYKSASDSQKAEALLKAKEYATNTAKDMVGDYELDGWVAKSKKWKIDPAAYIEFLLQLDKAGADSTPTQKETKAALEATDFSQREKEKIWSAVGDRGENSWKSNPYKK